MKVGLVGFGLPVWIVRVLVLTVALACVSRRGVRAPSAAPSDFLGDVRARPGSIERAGTLEGDFADPFILRAAGAYLAFATGARHRHLQVARSSDLLTWTELGDALPSLPVWAATGDGFTWAPAVLARGSSFVLYYTTRHAASGFQCISVATATNPAGPYVDASPGPLLCQTGDAAGELCGSIDPSPFVDVDGAAHLLWKSDENSAACRGAPRLWSQRLANDGRRLVGDPTVLLARTSPWEGDIIEAPAMTFHGGRYYLFYSANWYASRAYAIGYATCAGPTGPCQKVTVSEPLLPSAGRMWGPGGQEVFTGADGRIWMAFHAWTAPRATYEAGGARRLRVAPLAFTPAGIPLIAADP